MATSLIDIARQRELSPSTVSKALNGYRDVASDTRELVLRAALELDYQPSSAARNLRRGRTDRIGLFLNTSIEYVSITSPASFRAPYAIRSAATSGCSSTR